MVRKPLPDPSPQRRQRGFEAAGGLVKAPKLSSADCHAKYG